MKPCTARISQPYGQFPQASGQPWIHVGDDYAGERGQEVVTIADGRVLFAGPGQNVPNDLADLLMLYRGSDASGNCVIVEHAGWVETFNHLEFYTVNTGDIVKRGWRVGGMGDSGNAYGVHLHHETLTVPASPVPPFSRYNPQFQIDYEDQQAGTIAPQATEIELAEDEIMAMTPKEREEFAELVALKTWQLNGVPNVEGGKQTIWRVLVSIYYMVRETSVTLRAVLKLLESKGDINIPTSQLATAVKSALVELAANDTDGDIK